VTELDDDLKHQVARALTDAADYVDEELSPTRTKATEYYLGMPFGDEEEGRSKVVSRDVSDTVRAILPSLLKIFTGSEKPLEFVPEGPEDVAMAEQATDYVSYVFFRDNDGYSALYSAFEDALVRGTGVIKSWWDDSVEVEIEQYEGLDDETLAALEADDEVEIIEQESYEDEIAKAEIEAMLAQQMAQMQEQIQQMAQQGMEVPPDVMQPPEPPPVPQVHDLTVRRTRKRGVIRAEAVPPEEILISRGARSFDDAAVVAHRTELTMSQLIAMGYDEDLLEEYAHSDELSSNEEYMTRHPEDVESGEETQDKILYTEAWMPLDVDGDGIAELRKVCCLGPGYDVVNVEFARHVPLAHFTPYPEPHRAIGHSVSDLVMDIQRIKSQVMRNMLDSLAQSIHPRTWAVEGEVNFDDLLNNEVGGVVRVRRPGMMGDNSTPFVGQQAFPMLQYLDELKEKRTGISDATLGLDAESMQSTTAVAVNATVQAAQMQLEMIARTFAETGMTRLYRNLLRLVTQYQDKVRMVRLRNTWVAMDPRSWNAEMDIMVTTAVSLSQERMQTLALAASKQEQVLQQLGPNNPVVGLGQYTQTLRKMVEIAGFKDADAFFRDLPADFEMPEDPQEQESPEQMLAAVQREAIQADVEKKRAELQLKEQETAARLQMDREKLVRSDDRERDRIETDVVLRALDIQAKHGMPVDLEMLMNLINRPREVQQ
jgi:hypothetical protein